MELQIQNGDYVPDGLGGFRRLTGGEALLQRVLFRLVPRRGAFPFMPELGSRLYLVLREKPAARQALAEQYVAEALAGESGLRVTEVSLAQEGDRGPADCPAGLAGRGTGRPDAAVRGGAE